MLDEAVKNFLGRFTKPEKIAFIVSIIGGIIAHGFIIANRIPNHDDMHYGFNIDNPVNRLTDMSRWLIPVVVKMGGGWSLPWLRGIISIVLLSVAAIMVVRLLRIKSPIYASLIGTFLVVFPPVTGTMTYMALADSYFLAILLAVTSAFLVSTQKKWAYAFGALCIAASMNLYQAYVPLYFSLLVLYAIKKYVESDFSFQDIIIFGIKSLIVAVVGIIISMISARLFFIGNSRFDGCYGIPIAAIPSTIRSSAYQMIKFFMMNSNGVSPTWAAVVFAVMAIIGVYSVIIIVMQEHKNLGISLLLAVIFIYSILSIYFMAYYNGVSVLMQYPFVMVLVAVLTLLDHVSYQNNGVAVHVNIASVGGAICAILLIWNYIVIANMSYMRLKIANDQIYAYAIQFVERAENTIDFHVDTDIVFLGKPSIEKNNLEFSEELWGGELLIGVLSPDMLLEGAATPYNGFQVFLQQHLGWNHTIYRHFMHYDDGGKKQSEQMKQQLSVYPEQGSMDVVDNTLYVRFE